MGELEEGVYVSDSVEKIVDSMLADAKEYFGKELNDSEESVIRTFYLPVAIELHKIQDDIGLVLESTQIDHADGEALDLLTALIGINRRPATYASGQATFGRNEVSNSIDYTIPSGTEIQTEAVDSVRFKTTETAVLTQGNTEVTAPVEAVETGPGSNVGPNTVVEFVNKPSGIEYVTNKSSIGGGSLEEPDEELRERAKVELAEGSRGTRGAVYRAINSLDGTEAVKIFPNSPNYNLGDDPGFELVVHGGNTDEIGQRLVEVKAAGDHTYSGNFGTAVSTSGELPNGQVHSERFSRPTEVDIYIEVTIDKSDEYAGDDAVKDSIVDYIGGVNTTGNTISGDVNVGEDVLYGEIEYSIRDVLGVFDVTNLYIGESSNPNGTSNITIQDFEVSTTDALNSQITIYEA